MKLRDLLVDVPLMGGECDFDMEIYSISYDSRTLESGALFVALPGEKTDGHRYIEAALARGARCVLCQQEGPGPRLVVQDARYALALAARNWYGKPGDEMILIGVTGTNGKTTTTNLIKAMLEGALGATVGLVGTNRNMIGALELSARRTTPESLELQGLLRRMANSGCTHVVMEVSSHALVQHRVAGLTFQVGVFTNLSQDHLDYHSTMEEYRRAKGLLFSQCRRGILNLDDEAGRWYQQQTEIPCLTYSENQDSADLTAKNISLHPRCVEFEAVARGQITRVHLPIPGGFSIYNALATLCCGLALGLSLENGARPLRTVRGVKGRAEVVSVPAPYTVIIDYAHTPNALENILLTARGFTDGRLICLFGCGGDRDRSKRPLMGSVAAELADFVVVTSDNPRTESPAAIIADILPGLVGWETPCHIEPDRVTAIRWVLDYGRAGDVIVLAGKGHETYQEVGAECLHLDERQVVAGFFCTGDKKMQKTGDKTLSDMVQ